MWYRKIAFSATSVPSSVRTHPSGRSCSTGRSGSRAEGFETIQATGKELAGLQYRIQVSVLDCLGCGNCADICPAKTKALTMEPLATQMDEVPNWEYATTLSDKSDLMKRTTVKGSQFVQPYRVLRCVCRLRRDSVRQSRNAAYGDRMMIANATGCSSIYGASAPSMPYTKDHNGRGPSWANSLFEDNAEYGFGMAMAARQMREKTKDIIVELKEKAGDAALAAACEDWLVHINDGEKTREVSDALMAALSAARLTGEAAQLAKDLEANKDFLVKKSVWCFGGDGWAYDIGYGGLDHVLASGEDINVLVLDTEVYSNTGGQSSKSTPTAAIAKFAASGKRVKKKDLGMLATTYGYIYVAMVAMGADKNQFLKAVREAEAYPGPSLIIAYSPCINHGLKRGMGKSQENEKLAVESGYWSLFRYNPELKKEGKNPFILDSKDPTGSFRDFIMDQVRYSSLAMEFPDEAEELFQMAEQHAMERIEGYKKMARGE